MIEISTKQKKAPVIIRQVNSQGYLPSDSDDQSIDEDMKTKLDALLVHPSAACVHAVVRYAQSLQMEG